MKKIYLDSDFRCHLADDGTMTAVETDAFDGKCDAYIEGYRFVPAGEVWIREDGEVFTGEMVSPWKDSAELDEEQGAFEKSELARLQEENAVLQEERADMVSTLALFGVTEEETV